MRKIISLYKPSYIGAVTYLLQSSEYKASWYLKSYWAVDDFDEIETFMTPEKTSAFKGFNLLNWIILISTYLLGLLLLPFGSGYAALGIGLIFMAPVITANVVVVPLILADFFIRRPREKRQINQAKEILTSLKAKKIAVAGSYGKTTMKEILAEVIGAKKKVAATPGNYNTPVGVSRFAAGLEGDEDVLIIEMGEYIPGDISQICEMSDPDYGVITGINEQHMQRMENIDNTISTVFELEDYIDKKNILVNSDSPLVKERMDKKNVAYDEHKAGGWKAKDVEISLAGTKFTAQKGKKKVSVESQLLGKYQIGPILAAVYLADKLGLKPADIEKGLSRTKPHGRRFNPRELANGAVFIDDTYNGNPDGFFVGIDFLSSLEDVKNRVYITGGIIELGKDKVAIHQWIGELLAKSSIDTILLIRTPATEWIAEGIADTDPEKEFQWIEPDQKIYENLDEFTSDGDVVLMQNWQREKVFYEL